MTVYVDRTDLSEIETIYNPDSRCDKSNILFDPLTEAESTTRPVPSINSTL